MPLVQIKDRAVFFAHIPKTGGSSLEHWLAEVGELTLRGKTPLEGMLCTPQHMQAELYAPLLEELEPVAEFAVIRDPLERMVSEYRYRRAQVLKKGKREMPPFERWAKRAMRLYGENAYFLDNHIRPQAEFVRPQTKLFRFEDGLKAVTSWLEKICEIQGPPLEHRLPSEGGDVPLSDALRDRIEVFYAADTALWESLS
ncbi:sulfotransferase family protein [Lentibacter sp. XHP0401]|uniref:sulfotransferase family protein n=1 Tax=Lentibacter sp. XHP0401 TaxID=2984334 RepID=UPI0021E8313D|nr:sulfotransferase family protein [Lentibacter sp. XHP0401]MCV2894094.1 sulfotransferase family protein [Lentibacter sp. XHP0401]